MKKDKAAGRRATKAAGIRASTGGRRVTAVKGYYSLY